MGIFSKVPGVVGSFFTRIINSRGSIRNRLIISTVGLTIVVLPVMGIVTFNISYGMLKDMLLNMSLSIANDSSESMDMILENIRSIADDIAYDETIREAYCADLENLPGIDKIKITTNIESIVKSNGNLNLNVTSLYFFGENGLSYYVDNMLHTYKENGFSSSVGRLRNSLLSAIGDKNFISSELYTMLLESGKDSMLLLDSEFPDDFFGKRLADSYSNCAALFCLIKADEGKSLGALVLLLDMDYIKSIACSRPIAGTSYYIIKNTAMPDTLYKTGKNPYQSMDLMPVIWRYENTTAEIDEKTILENIKANTDGYGFINTQPGDALVLYNSLQNADWIFVEVVLMSSHIMNLSTIKKTTVILVVLFTITAILAALFISGFITGSLKRFAGLFKWNGDLKLLTTYNSTERRRFNFIRWMSFQRKILLIFIPVIIIPTITLTTISLYVTSNIIKSGDISLWKNAFNQATKKMDFDLSIKRDILQLFLRNESLQKILSMSKKIPLILITTKR